MTNLTVFDGVISGTGPVVIDSAVLVGLAGANTFTEGMIVRGGVLAAENSEGSATGVGPVTVLANASIAGDGVGRRLTFAGGLSLEDGAVMRFNLGHDSASQVRVSGGFFSQEGTIRFEVRDSGDLAGGQAFTLVNFEGASLKGIDLSDIELDLSTGFAGALDFVDQTMRLKLVGPSAPCLADIDGDNIVGTTDIARVLANYGTPHSALPSDGDLTGDAAVGFDDLTLMLSRFGIPCEA